MTKKIVNKNINTNILHFFYLFKFIIADVVACCKYVLFQYDICNHSGKLRNTTRFVPNNRVPTFISFPKTDFLNALPAYQVVRISKP